MSRLDYQPLFGEGRPDTRDRRKSSLTYVWIYENGVKKFSKGDDIKIKRIVSLLPSTRLSSFYCCPFSFAISFLSFTWLGVRYEWFGTNYWHRFQKSSHTYIKKSEKVICRPETWIPHSVSVDIAFGPLEEPCDRLLTLAPAEVQSSREDCIHQWSNKLCWIHYLHPWVLHRPAIKEHSSFVLILKFGNRCHGCLTRPELSHVIDCQW